MAEILKPSNLSLTWASGGDVLNPGDTKYATGWQVEIPPRQWFNYLDNRQDTALAHINQHGVVVWDNTTEYQEDKSYVQGTTNGTVYRCIQTHSGQNPETDVGNVYWIVAFGSAGDFYTKTEADSTFLTKSSNLSDLSNAATARTNLSVYSQTQTYTKTEVDNKTTVASTPQAHAGTSNTTLITPLRLSEWSQVNSFGVAQVYQDLTGSRSLNTTYTNSTGRPIEVKVVMLDEGSFFSIAVVNGVTVEEWNQPTSIQSTMSFVVPRGHTYSVSGNGGLAGGNTLSRWVELR